MRVSGDTASSREEKPILAVLDVVSKESRETIESRFGREFEVRFVESADPSEVVEAGRDATAMLVIWSRVDAQLIDQARRCKVIQKLGVGVDKIDLAAARSKGVTVLRAAGVNASAVADLTVLLTLAVLRRFRWATEELRAGRFQKEALRSTTFQLEDKVVGLIGLGYIGRAAARRFSAFDAKLQYYDVRRLLPDEERELGVAYVPFERLLATSDVLSLHVPSTPETRGMLNADALRKMKRGVVIVNTARGELIDSDALVEALREGIVFGAGLDVTWPEPLPPHSPLFEFENVVITPHIGGAVANNFCRVVDHAYRNVKAVLSGGAVPAADVVVAGDGLYAPR